MSDELIYFVPGVGTVKVEHGPLEQLEMRPDPPENEAAIPGWPQACDACFGAGEGGNNAVLHEPAEDSDDSELAAMLIFTQLGGCGTIVGEQKDRERRRQGEGEEEEDGPRQ